MYGSVNQQQKIEGIVWLTGGGATLAAIDEYLSEKLDLPVEVLDPLKLLQGKVKNKSELEACTFSVAIGLAIRGIQWQGGKHVA